MKFVVGPLSQAALLLLLTVCAAAAQEGNTKITDTKPGDVRVLVSTGLKASLDPVKAEAEKAIGHPLAISYGPSKSLQTQIENGGPFEAAILTRDVIDAMIAEGKIVPGSATDIGHVVVAFALKGDAPSTVNIKSAAGVKALLLGAKQVRWLGIGASAPTVNNLLAKLQIADALAGRIATETSSQTVPQVSGPGEYEVLLNLNSELHPINGWTLLGVVPKRYQVPIVESVGIGAHGNAVAGKAFIAFLKGRVFEKSLVASGMTR